MKQTTNYKLKKPDYADTADVAILNSNMDIIDAKMKEIEDAEGQGGGSSVSWTQIQQSGTKIAEVTIDGNKTNVYAPSGSGGSGSGHVNLDYANEIIIGNDELTLTATIDCFLNITSRCAVGYYMIQTLTVNGVQLYTNTKKSDGDSDRMCSPLFPVSVGDNISWECRRSDNGTLWEGRLNMFPYKEV